MSATDILQDFVRSFWEAHFKALRGALPATGDREAVMDRMRLSNAVKQIRRERWAVVKDMIRDFRQHKEK